MFGLPLVASWSSAFHQTARQECQSGSASDMTRERKVFERLWVWCFIRNCTQSARRWDGEQRACSASSRWALWALPPQVARATKSEVQSIQHFCPHGNLYILIEMPLWRQWASDLQLCHPIEGLGSNTWTALIINLLRLDGASTRAKLEDLLPRTEKHVVRRCGLERLMFVFFYDIWNVAPLSALSQHPLHLLTFDQKRSL